MTATHVTTDTLLRVRAMDNAKDALQGTVKPDPNEFFEGTLFRALFPEGSTYESLMPPLPLRAACIMLLGLAACSDPSRNIDVVSLNLNGPVQINHEAVIDESTGVLLSSNVNATAQLKGQVYRIPPDVVPLLPPHLTGLSEAPIGMDADWTITEELEGDLPAPGRAAVTGFSAMALAAAAIGGLGLAFVLRRRRGAKPAETGSAGDQEVLADA